MPCDLCGSQENLRRQKMKRLLATLAEEDSRIPANIFAALGNVKPSHLWDHELRDVDARESMGDPGTVAPGGIIPRERLVR